MQTIPLGSTAETALAETQSLRHISLWTSQEDAGTIASTLLELGFHPDAVVALMDSREVPPIGVYRWTAVGSLVSIFQRERCLARHETSVFGHAGDSGSDLGAPIDIVHGLITQRFPVNAVVGLLNSRETEPANRYSGYMLGQIVTVQRAGVPLYVNAIECTREEAG